MADREAFVRAIAADPSNDVARLAFADWLDENDDPARAEFVRVQVEAADLPPHAARCRLLTDRARELFDAHWPRWWAEVTAGVELPPPGRPVPPPPARRNWRDLARRVWAGPDPKPRPIGWPYRRSGLTIAHVSEKGTRGLFRAEYVRGFPDALVWPVWSPAWVAAAPGFLERWVREVPLTAFGLELHTQVPDLRPLAAAPLRRVTELTFHPGPCPPATADEFLNLPVWDSVRAFAFRSPSYTIADGDPFARGLLTAPLTRNLRRLSLTDITITPDLLTRFSGDASFRGLTELRLGVLHLRTDADEAVEVGADESADADGSTTAEELDVRDARAVTDALRAATADPVWAGLEGLAIGPPLTVEGARAVGEARLPELIDVEVSFDGEEGNAALTAFAAGPLVRRVRHLTIRTDARLGPWDEGFVRLAEAVNPAAETVAVGGAYDLHSLRNQTGDAFRRRFGNRFVFL